MIRQNPVQSPHLALHEIMVLQPRAGPSEPVHHVHDRRVRILDFDFRRPAWGVPVRFLESHAHAPHFFTRLPRKASRNTCAAAIRGNQMPKCSMSARTPAIAVIPTPITAAKTRNSHIFTESLITPYL